MTKRPIDIVRSKRMCKIIKDPFPEHTQHEMTMQSLGYIGRVFGLKNKKPAAPKDISIWEAWRLGYETAYQEVYEALSKN